MLALVAGDKKYPVVAVTICLNGLLFGNHLSSYVLSADDGDDEMRRVSDPIRQGAEGANSRHTCATMCSHLPRGLTSGVACVLQGS